MPLGKCVKLSKLSGHELTGGQIKNVVLQAARYAAAAKHKSVKQKHFQRAIRATKKPNGLMGTHDQRMMSRLKVNK